jgi:hypothetical protein
VICEQSASRRLVVTAAARVVTVVADRCLSRLSSPFALVAGLRPDGDIATIGCEQRKSRATRSRGGPSAVCSGSWDESPRLGRTAGSAVAPCRLDALT